MTTNEQILNLKSGSFTYDRYEFHNGTKSYRLTGIPTETDRRNIAVQDGGFCCLYKDGYFWINF